MVGTLLTTALLAAASDALLLFIASRQKRSHCVFLSLLVTNLPKVELNHTVIAYDYRIYEGRFLEFIVYDPNEPEEPGRVAFDRAERTFFASGVYDTEPGTIRAFRMYYSPFL